MTMRSKMRMLVALLGASLVTACGSSSTGGDDQGNLLVLLEAEQTIVEGLQAGEGEESIRDGYDISFDRYVVAVGNVAMSQVGNANPQSSAVVVIADFKSLSTTQPALIAFDGIPTGQYTSFGFETPVPQEGAENFNQIAEEEITAMVENGWSYIIDGTIARASDPESSKRFLIEADVPAVYTDCALEGEEPGVNVASSSSVDITLHGDHIFFNGFPEDEGNVVRLAQWLWDIEDDGDGVLTRVDFEGATDIGSLFPSPTYELTGGPLPIENAWDFIRAQLATQGHIFGEGECEWTPLP